MKSRKSFVRLCPLILLSSSCAARGPLRLDLKDDVERPPHSVVLLFVDGMDYVRFDKLLANGKLPNIKRIFVDGGVGVDRAFTSIPAMTYPNTVSLMTGRFPGHHDVVGNQWFDRRTLAYPNYITAAEYDAVNDHFRWPTLFEVLPKHFSVNVLGNVSRGATYNVDRHYLEGLGWGFRLYERVNELSAGGLNDATRLANAVQRWPSVIVMYFPGIDQIGHEEGSDSPHYADAMVDIDIQVGRIWDVLERNGLLIGTYGVLVTDHSHVPTRGCRRIDLVRWLRNHRNMRIHTGRIFGDDYADRLKELDGADAVLVDGSYRRVVLYLRGKAGWFESTTHQEVLDFLRIDELETSIWDIPGVGVVCIRDGENRVRVFSSKGEIVIARRKEPDESLSYRIEAPEGSTLGNPLGYSDGPVLKSFVDAGWHPSRDWLAATADSKYPDFVPQIVEYFDSLRAGDIVVFADECAFFSGCDHGEHGAPLYRDMRIPMFFAGPDIPKGGHLTNARIVDVMPTIVDLLGESEKLKEIPPIDGRSLAAQLRSATRPGATTRQSANLQRSVTQPGAAVPSPTTQQGPAVGKP